MNGICKIVGYNMEIHSLHRDVHLLCRRYQAEQEEMRQLWGEEIKLHTVVIDDKLYAALKMVMTEWVPVCIGKEDADPGEGYPDVKIRNSSIEKQV